MHICGNHLHFLCHFTVTNEALQDTNAALEDQTKLHHILETYVRTNHVGPSFLNETMSSIETFLTYM